MLISLGEMMRDYGLQPAPTLHIGAHLAEEAPAYARHGFLPVWWVEGNDEIFEALQRRVVGYADQFAVSAVCADAKRQVTFHVASNGESSSILPLGTHQEEHPEVTYIGERVLWATTVDELYTEGSIGEAEFLNIDVQGAELEVLCGAVGYLQSVQAVYLEVNDNELYEGCALFPEVQEWLGDHGFRLVVKRMTRHGWGDALFMR